MRDAISLLDQSLSVSRQLQVEQVNRVAGVGDKATWFSLAQGVMENDCRRILEQIHQLYQNSFDLERLCRDLHGHFRDLMLAKTIPAQQLERYVAGSPETREQLTAQAEGFSLPALLHAMTALQQAQTRMTRTGDARMELELCLVELASQKADCSLEGLLRRVEALEQLARQGQAPGRQSPRAVRPCPAVLSPRSKSRLPWSGRRPPEHRRTPSPPRFPSAGTGFFRRPGAKSGPR